MNIKNTLLIIILIFLFFTLLNKNNNTNEYFNNYLLYNDQKNFYMRFLDRFHGMNSYYIHQPILYNRYMNPFMKIPGNMGVIKL